MKLIFNWSNFHNLNSLQPMQLELLWECQLAWQSICTDQDPINWNMIMTLSSALLKSYQRLNIGQKSRNKSLWVHDSVTGS